MIVVEPGRRFGRLVILHQTDRTNAYGKKFFLCKCNCGNEVEVRRDQLVNGKTTSCGCYSGEVSRDKLEKAWDGKCRATMGKAVWEEIRTLKARVAELESENDRLRKEMS